MGFVDDFFEERSTGTTRAYFVGPPFASAVFPGSLDHFRAFLDRLKTKSPGGWISADGARLRWQEIRTKGSARAAWDVHAQRGDDQQLDRWRIDAFENPDLSTQIEFLFLPALERSLDPGLGAGDLDVDTAFEKFAQYLVSHFAAMEQHADEQPAQAEGSAGFIQQEPSHQRSLEEDVVKRRHQDWTYEQIARSASCSRSTVYRILSKYGMVKKRQT